MLDACYCPAKQHRISSIQHPICIALRSKHSRAFHLLFALSFSLLANPTGHPDAAVAHAASIGSGYLRDGNPGIVCSSRLSEAVSSYAFPNKLALRRCGLLWLSHSDTFLWLGTLHSCVQLLSSAIIPSVSLLSWKLQIVHQGQLNAPRTIDLPTGYLFLDR